MKIGLQINKFTWPKEPQSIGDTFKTIAQTAEKEGFYSIWVMDHFFQISYVGKKEEPMLEGYTALGFLAGCTSKVKLGTLVTGVIYREPALLIKAVTTLDVLSKGRAYFGIGAAWNEEESVALGFRFPPLKERFERLEETLKIAHQMFKDDAREIKGAHYHLKEPINHPTVISKPHPPIMIGGVGEKKTLKFVAQYADACNIFARLGEEEVKRKLDILKKHCKDAGRNYDDIEKTALDQVPEGFDPDELVAECKKLKKMGFSHVIFGVRNVNEIKPLKIIGEKVIPKVASL